MHADDLDRDLSDLSRCVEWCDICREAHGGMGIHEMAWKNAMERM